MLFEAMGQALGFFTQIDFVLFLTLGSVIGVIFGVIPGLTGLLAMALILPFAYQMEMHLALAFMLSAYASSCTGGSLTAIILGIPGTPANTATILDGYPMFKKGNGRKAISIAVWTSIFGGILGAVYFAALIPIAYQAGLLFEAPEIFMTVVLALVFLSMAGEGRTLVKGVIGGLIGMLLGFIGFQNLTAEARFTYGIQYLISGLTIVPLALGTFGIPELFELMVTSRGTGSTAKVGLSLKDMFYGITKILENLKLFFISSILGAVVGIIPGVGGETSTFVCYSYAKATSKNPEEFGQGCELGVLAPETSNNAKEGGSLLPTLAFGIPGSAAMAILLGGLLVVGLQPGPHLLKENADLAFLLTYTLAFSNIIGGVLILIAATPVCALVTSPITILAPALGVTMSIGVYLVQTNIWDVVFMFLMGFLGHFLKKYGFSRAALLVAFVLTNTAELQLDIVNRAYGLAVFKRPIFLFLILLTLFIVFWSYAKAKKGWEKEKSAPRGENIFILIVLAVSLNYLLQAVFIFEGTQLFPILVSSVTIVLVLRLLVGSYRSRRRRETDTGPEEEPGLIRLKKQTLFELSGMVVALYLFGLGIGAFLFAIYYNRRKGKGWLPSLVLGVILGVLGHIIPVVIGYMPYKGLFIDLIS
ncbi:MAG: tripartite tricarboxylate transporter permease [Pseudomonadota bacterium]